MRETYQVLTELGIVVAGILAVYLLMCEMKETPISEQNNVTTENAK